MQIKCNPQAAGEVPVQLSPWYSKFHITDGMWPATLEFSHEKANMDGPMQGRTQPGETVGFETSKRAVGKRTHVTQMQGKTRLNVSFSDEQISLQLLTSPPPALRCFTQACIVRAKTFF